MEAARGAAACRAADGGVGSTREMVVTTRPTHAPSSILDALPAALMRHILAEARQRAATACDAGAASLVAPHWPRPHAAASHHSQFCDVASAMLLTSTCRQLRALHAHDSLWHRIAVRAYGAAFWSAAKERPRASALPLSSPRHELRRMLRFERRHTLLYGREFTVQHYAALWRWRDGHEPLEERLPWLCPPLLRALEARHVAAA